MATLDQYRQIIQRVINEHARLGQHNGAIQYAPIFDQATDRYTLIAQGWQGRRRIHACIIHIDLIGDKVWVQHDGTDYGIANELCNAGIPKDKIVLGFKSPELRQYTEFAAA